MKGYCVDQIQLTNEVVFVRIDGNVPLSSSGHIADDARLTACLETILYVKERARSFIIGTHMGRPLVGRSLEEQHASTKVLAEWFIEKGVAVEFFQEWDNAAHFLKTTSNGIVLLENLRSYEGEFDPSGSIVSQIASVATVYINDAFGAMHRSDASIIQLPLYIKKKGYGFLVKKELDCLKKIQEDPDHPWGIIMGGNKSQDKLLLLQKILQKPVVKQPAFLLLGGLLGLVFLVAEGKIVYAVDQEVLILARLIQSISKKCGIELVLPIDHVYKESLIIDIGHETIALFASYIQQAKTIFYNGTMGKYEWIEGSCGTEAILRTLAKSSAFSIIGGGNAVDVVHRLGLEAAFGYVSTGGGATLAFLAASDPWKELPGLYALGCDSNSTFV